MLTVHRRRWLISLVRRLLMRLWRTLLLDRRWLRNLVRWELWLFLLLRRRSQARATSALLTGHYATEEIARSMTNRRRCRL